MLTKPVDYLFSVGIFESICSYEYKIFRLSEHIDRFYASAKSSGINVSIAKNKVRKLINDKLKKKKIKNAYIRLSLNCFNLPSPPPFYEKRLRGGIGNIEVKIKPIKKYPDHYYTKGVSIKTSIIKKDMPTNFSAQIKSKEFLSGILAKIDFLEENDIFENIILSKKGYVTEGAISNIFIFKRGICRTPPLYLGVLEGVTRNEVKKILKRLRIECIEEPFTRNDIFNADEVFLTSTFMEVVPVVCCDNRKIGNGKAGQLAKKLRRILCEKLNVH